MQPASSHRTWAFVGLCWSDLVSSWSICRLSACTQNCRYQKENLVLRAFIYWRYRQSKVRKWYVVTILHRQLDLWKTIQKVLCICFMNHTEVCNKLQKYCTCVGIFAAVPARCKDTGVPNGTQSLLLYCRDYSPTYLLVLAIIYVLYQFCEGNY